MALPKTGTSTCCWVVLGHEAQGLGSLVVGSGFKGAQDPARLQRHRTAPHCDRAINPDVRSLLQYRNMVTTSMKCNLALEPNSQFLASPAARIHPCFPQKGAGSAGPG